MTKSAKSLNVRSPCGTNKIKDKLVCCLLFAVPHALTWSCRRQSCTRPDWVLFQCSSRIKRLAFLSTLCGSTFSSCLPTWSHHLDRFGFYLFRTWLSGSCWALGLYQNAGHVCLYAWEAMCVSNARAVIAAAVKLTPRVNPQGLR